MVSTAGSSPRMRGTRPTHANRDCHPGIIPAHAGNTRPSPRPSAPSGDHPRACGEHVRADGDGRAIGWIIPAHAGNTSSARNSDRRTGDHPRACGEHHRLTIFPHRTLGSSPRMRGTRCLRMSLRSIRGIIPAHAGNTHGIGGLRPYRRDHPRACGEHHRDAFGVDDAQGSSPRMRGTPFIGSREFAKERIIPAHAGNTCSRPGPQSCIGDHPRRMRGTPTPLLPAGQ